MIVTTTPFIEGRTISAYKGIVVGEAIIGTNVIADMVSSVTDFFGGGAGGYEGEVQEARATALREMQQRAARLGADAVVGVDLDCEGVGHSMVMVTATGTAVVLS